MEGQQPGRSEWESGRAAAAKKRRGEGMRALDGRERERE